MGPSFSWAWLWSLLSGASGDTAKQVAALLLGAFHDFESGVNELQEAGKLLGIQPATAPAPAPVALSVEDEECKRKCLEFLGQHGGVHAEGLGSRLGDFLKNNPWVLTLIGQLLKGAVGA